MSMWMLISLILSIHILVASSLRCHDDINGPLQLMENCRACIIFIAPLEVTTVQSTTKLMVLPRRHNIEHHESTIEESFLFNEGVRRKRRRRTLSNETVIHQQCDQKVDGPLYGYDQTHCYCNSNQCNSNIQRCIYEVTSKRYFACYHGSNSSQYPLEIRHKCRSCRIYTLFDSIHYYECLTFGEREQNNRTQCTCQRPMCNQDALTCQRFQQTPSQPRTNIITKTHFDSSTSESISSRIVVSTSVDTTMYASMTTITNTSRKMTSSTATTMATTKTTTTTTTTLISTTVSTTTLPSTSAMLSKMMSSPSGHDESSLMAMSSFATTDSIVIETDQEFLAENGTIISTIVNLDNTTTIYELKPLKTALILADHHEHDSASSVTFRFSLFQLLFALVIYSM